MTPRSKIARVLMTLTFALAALSLGATPVFAEDPIECESPSVVNRHAGIAWDGPNGNTDVHGIESRINPPAGMNPCSTNIGNDGVSAWIAIVPDNAPNSQAILQIGILNSNGPNGTGGDSFKYFWANGGCGPIIPDQAIPEYLGVADRAGHTYKINTAGDHFNLLIDDVIVRSIDYDDGRISCWANGDKASQLAGETLDGGDHFSYSELESSADGQKLTFRYANFENANGNWNDVDAGTPQYCTAADTQQWNNTCQINANTGMDGLNIWSRYDP